MTLVYIIVTIGAIDKKVLLRNSNELDTLLDFDERGRSLFVGKVFPIILVILIGYLIKLT